MTPQLANLILGTVISLVLFALGWLACLHDNPKRIEAEVQRRVNALLAQEIDRIRRQAQENAPIAAKALLGLVKARLDRELIPGRNDLAALDEQPEPCQFAWPVSQNGGD